MYFIAAFMALAGEAVWSSRYLAPERLLSALAIYGGFGLFYLGVPLDRAQAGKTRCGPSGHAGVLLLASIGLLFFLSSVPVAGASLWGLALLLAVLNVCDVRRGRRGRRGPWLAGGGTVLSWLVLATWWVERRAGGAGGRRR